MNLENWILGTYKPICETRLSRGAINGSNRRRFLFGTKTDKCGMFLQTVSGGTGERI
jgi:hypothetical protein